MIESDCHLKRPLLVYRVWSMYSVVIFSLTPGAVYTMIESHCQRRCLSDRVINHSEYNEARIRILEAPSTFAQRAVLLNEFFPGVLAQLIVEYAGKNDYGNLYQHMTIQLTQSYNHGIAITSLVVDHDCIIAGSSNKIICMWDIDSGGIKRVLWGHKDTVSCLAISGGLLASGSHDRTIRVWDRERATSIHTLIGHVGVVRALAEMDSEGVIASGGQDNQIKIWNIKRGECLRTMATPCGISSLLSIPNKYLIAGCHNCVRIWKSIHPPTIYSLHATHKCCIADIAIYNNHGIISASCAGLIEEWGCKSSQRLDVYEKGPGTGRGIMVDDNGCIIAGGGNGIFVYDPIKGVHIPIDSEPLGILNRLASRPGGEGCVTVHGDTLCIWNRDIPSS